MHYITLKGADRERGAAIISGLFSRYSSVARSDEGIRLVGSIAYALPCSFVEEFLKELWNNQTRRTAQACGELLVLIALRDKQHEWADDLLNKRRESISAEPDELSESFRTGVAFAAGRMWDETAARSKSVQILARIAPNCSGRIAFAFGTVFWATDDFSDDQDTENLLNVIANHPCAIHPTFVSDLVNHLAILCKFQREPVRDVTRVIVDTFGKQLGDMSTALFGAGAHLVNIAMTLQRFAETRDEGLTLLEDLMRLGVGEAFSILNDIDIRPATITRQSPRRRRRRRKAT